MYPIKFENIYYEKIWGGRDLENFRKNLPDGDIGESWDIACHPNGTGVVSNGEFKGKSLKELIEQEGKALLGKNYNGESFPLLVKLINSKDKLSVQVHPSDEYAKKYENSFGKTEAWYVVDAKPGSYLIVGTKDCDKETFKKAIDEGKTEDYLNKIEVKKGDSFLINSGLVHAICEGVIIAEIQQNSDITYRIYDYGRPREIHVEKSLEVIDFDLKAINSSKKELEKFDINLGKVLSKLKEDDLLIITADHGNDPTYKGSDHTREFVPFLSYSPSMIENGLMETSNSFAAIGATIADNFKLEMPENTIGESVLEKHV